MRVLKARILVCHSLLQLTFFQTLHHDLSWVALNGMSHSFIELHKSVIYDLVLVSFL